MLLSDSTANGQVDNAFDDAEWWKRVMDERVKCLQYAPR